MYFEYDVSRNPADPSWERVPRRGSEYTGRQVFVLKDAPDLSSVTVPSVATDAENPAPSAVKLWQGYRDDVSKELAEYAFGDANVNAAGYLDTDAAFKTGQQGQNKFYVTFDVTGTLASDLKPEELNPSLLTIIQVAGAGRRVGEYRFYVLNVNTGTQLVFE